MNCVLKRRYNYSKKLYKNYIILIRKETKYYTFNIDKEIIKYIFNKEYLVDNDLNNLNVSYIILDNLEIKDKKSFNNYELYVKK